MSANVALGGTLRGSAAGRPAPDSVQAGGETPSRQAVRGRAFLVVPLVLVNLAAVWGQAGWAFENITTGGWPGLIVSILFAAAVESIGVYLAWESHESLMADQASAQLRLGSYAIGVLAGVLNFLHFSAQSFATGIAFGALSAISPWLWAIWSRARNRARLAELGLVDVRGVKLSTARKLWHPLKSVRVLSWAAWEGITDPLEAVSGWEGAQSAPLPVVGNEAVRATETPVLARHALPEAVDAVSEPQEAPVTVVEALEAPGARKARILALRADESLSAEEIGRRVGVSGRRVRQVLQKAAS